MAAVLPCVRVRPRTENPPPGVRPAAERYAVAVQVGILTEQGHLRGRVRDISVTGACIERSAERPQEGSRVQLGFAFYAHALPVPMQGRVVRHTPDGGFAVEFEDVDFRTQVLLRALLPNVSSEGFPAAGISLNESGRVELDLPPVLREACLRAAARQQRSLEEWIAALLESAARAELD